MYQGWQAYAMQGICADDLEGNDMFTRKAVDSIQPDNDT